MFTKKRYFRKEDQKAIIDMDDFLVTYATEKLGPQATIAEKIYSAAKDDLKGLDKLFKDHGFGREHKFIEIAHGFISDLYEVNGQQNRKDALKFAQTAINYLGAHAHQFDVWKNE